MDMFDRNQNHFPSYVHRLIWSHGLRLLPPELWPKNAANNEAYTALYQYKRDMFTDMYQNPSLYHIDAEGITDAAAGRPWHKAHLSAKWNKQRARLTKLDEVAQTNLPHVVCRQLLDYLKHDGESNFMTKSDYDKFFVKQTLKKCGYKISEDDFLFLLERCGLGVTQNGDKVYFANKKYPQMFAAVKDWQALLASVRTVSTLKYRYDSAFTHLDCRFFTDGHSLSLQNSKWYMNDETIAYLNHVSETIAGNKPFSKLDNTTRIAIGFRMKGGGFFEFDHAGTHPTVLVKLFKYNSPEHMVFEEKINQLPNADEVRATFLKWVRRCNRCPCRPVEKASMIGNPRVIFGRNMKLCGPHVYLRTTDLCGRSLALMQTILCERGL